MKELDDLKAAVRTHMNKLEKKGLYVQSIDIRCIKEASQQIPALPYMEQTIKREVVVNMSSAPESNHTMWI